MLNAMNKTYSSGVPCADVVKAHLSFLYGVGDVSYVSPVRLSARENDQIPEGIQSDLNKLSLGRLQGTFCTKFYRVVVVSGTPFHKAATRSRVSLKSYEGLRTTANHKHETVNITIFANTYIFTVAHIFTASCDLQGNTVVTGPYRIQEAQVPYQHFTKYFRCGDDEYD